MYWISFHTPIKKVLTLGSRQSVNFLAKKERPQMHQLHLHKEVKDSEKAS